jgi:hypothetical protein
MKWLGSFLVQPVSSIDRAIAISTFVFDAIWFIDFLTRILIHGLGNICSVLNLREFKIELYGGVGAIIVSI